MDPNFFNPPKVLQAYLHEMETCLNNGNNNFNFISNINLYNESSKWKFRIILVVFDLDIKR